MISEFRAGRVVGDSFKLVFRHFLTIVPIAFICALPMLFVVDQSSKVRESRIEAYRRNQAIQPYERDATATLASLSFYVTYPLALGAIAFAVNRSMRGERVSFFESFGAGLKRVLGLFGLFISSLLFTGMGFLPAILFVAYGFGTIPWVFLVPGALLLLIPGFALAMMVYIAIPISIVEKKGVFASMRRSRELTAGHRWQLFAAVVGTFLLGYLIALVAGMVAGVGLIAGSSNVKDVVASPTTTKVMTFAIMTFFFALTAATPAVAYCHLQGFKELSDGDEVAKLFD